MSNASSIFTASPCQCSIDTCTVVLLNKQEGALQLRLPYVFKGLVGQKRRGKSHLPKKKKKT